MLELRNLHKIIVKTLHLIFLFVRVLLSHTTSHQLRYLFFSKTDYYFKKWARLLLIRTTEIQNELIFEKKVKLKCT